MGVMAEIHGKLRQSDTLQRSEDLLTSNVFQLIRYLPLAQGLGPILERAQTVDGAHLALPPTAKHCRLRFWPAHESCEPDVGVLVLDADAKTVGRYFIEAKYLHGKSGDAETDEDEVYEEGSDQLQREWDELCSVAGDCNYGLIYLTAHYAMPMEQIVNSVEAVERSEDARKTIYWVNWQAIWEHMRILDREFSDWLVTKDLKQLLTHKKLTWWSGWDLDSSGEAPQASLLDFYGSTYFHDLPVKSPGSLDWRFARDV